jgi:hypothetical protein
MVDDESRLHAALAQVGQQLPKAIASGAFIGS